MRTCHTHAECPHCRWIQLGPPGASDLIGVRSGGRILAIEVKRADGVQNEAQMRFQRMIERFGGEYVLARRIEDVP